MKRITTVATGGIEVNEDCDVCGNVIQRDVYFEVTGTESVAFWFGTCGCDSRKWRWRSATGEAPWELIGPLG